MISMAPRFFILPIVALIVIGSLPATAPADARSGAAGLGCGPAIVSVTDSAVRASFQDFERTQSAAAAKVCAIFANSAQ
jgi:hypothetical protein